MRICFMGTPDFAVPALERLIGSRHEVCLVVTQPSKPRGRGRKVGDPPVKVVADAKNIPVIQPASLKREPIDQTVRGLAIDVIVVVAYGKLLPDALLAAPRIGCLNIHASLLPEYRGAAPIQRALMEGRTETGVTIMRVVTELDAGPIVSQEAVEIQDDDDAQSISGFLSVIGADLLIRALEEIEKEGCIEGEAQDEATATYAQIITKSEGEVPWRETSREIMCRLRALTPWPGLFTTLRGRRLLILQAEPLEEDHAAGIDATEDTTPGCVSGIEKGFGFAVKTGDGHLLIRRLQFEGKSAMDADVFLNGAKLEVGERLGEGDGEGFDY